MRATKESTMYPIEVLDTDSCTTGREVEVYIDFTISVDNAYGADADGNRGERRVEYDVQDVYVQPEVERTLLAEELAQVKRDAEAKFEDGDKHW